MLADSGFKRCCSRAPGLDGGGVMRSKTTIIVLISSAIQPDIKEGYMDLKSYSRALELCQALSGVLDCGFCSMAGICSLHRLEQDLNSSVHLSVPVVLPKSVLASRARQRNEAGDSRTTCRCCEYEIRDHRYRLRISLFRKNIQVAGADVCIPCQLSGVLDASFVLERYCLAMLLATETDEKFRTMWCIPGGRT